MRYGCGSVLRPSRSACRPVFPGDDFSAKTPVRTQLSDGKVADRSACLALLLLTIVWLTLAGCGAGGYAGSGITGISSSSITIDAGQSMQITASLAGDALIGWSIAGSSCSASACGTLSATTGSSVTYTAPQGISKPFQSTVTAALAGTGESQVVNVTVNPDPSITGTLPGGTVGIAYNTTLTASGGTAPLMWTIAGPLPHGLTFDAKTGVISGTPTTAGSSSFIAQVVDASDVPYTVKATETITISDPTAPLNSLSGNPPTGTVGVAYLTLLSASGGTPPYSFSLTSGTLPNGLTLQASTGIIGGTPVVAGTWSFTAEVEDAANATSSASLSITINPIISGQGLILSVLPDATVGVPYSAMIGVTGGVGPYTCQETGGTLPAGLALSSACLVSGTPTAAGTSAMTVKATDSSSPALTTTGPENITVAPAGSLTLAFPPNGTVGTPYSGTIGVSGGTAPYSCTIVGGGLPAGLSLGTGCLISGTPWAAGTTLLDVTATDSSKPVKTITSPVSLTILASPLTLTLSTLPGASVGVAYTANIGVSGGTAPYGCTQTGGSLPAGLALAANCIVSGTPTAAGTFTVTVKATDSSSPSNSVTGPEAITVSPAGSLVLVGPPAATVGMPYSGTITVSGGIAPYSCTQAGGTLPAGLSLSSSCVVSGTPTAAGTSNITVKATDSSSPVRTTTGPVSITVSPAPLNLTLSTLPSATVGVAYSATVGVTGGTAPYACTLAGGALPAGLSLSTSCVVSGTPTTAGSLTAQVKATDASSPVETVTGPETIVVSPAPLTLTTSTLPNATVGTPYSAPIGVSGGTSPYSCSLAGGTLPAGLSLSTSCVVSGTPTTAGSFTAQVKATDASSPVETITGPETIVVSPAPLTLTTSTLPNATVGTPYSATIGVSGGTAPYACSIVSGTLPAGLSLGAGCVISGTPTVAGTVTLGVKATDSSNPVETTTGPVGLNVISAPPTLTLTSPPSATVDVPYTGTIGITGGTAPYTCSLAGGTLPGGLTLSSGCVISGIPSTSGATSITVKATDSSSPAAMTTGSVTITVLPSTTTLTLSSPPNAEAGVPYSGAIGVTGGTSPYNCSLVSGTLPNGLTLGSACNISGTPTAAGNSAVTIHAVDSTTPTPNTVTGPVTVTVTSVPTLTLSGSLPNATLGVAYAQALTASGGIKPYTYTLTAGGLPPGLSFSSDGTISGTPTKAGASSFTVTVTDTEGTPQTASLPLVLLVVYPATTQDAELIGPYAFLFQGYDDVAAGVLAYQMATIGSFTADGTGIVGDGELDSNHQSSNPSGNTIASHQFLGTYTLDANSRGYMTITTLNSDGTTGASSTYAITAKAPVPPGTVTTEVAMIEFDDNGLVGTRGSGTMLAQQPVAFSAGLDGSYAFGLSGDTPCLPACTIGIIAGPAAAVGQFSTDGTSLLTGGTSDANIATTNYANETLTGSYGLADGNGRVQLAMNTAGTPGAYPSDFAVYLVSANQAFLMSIDKHSTYVLLAGTTQLQTQTTFSNESMSGAVIGYENAQSDPGLLSTTLQNVLNVSMATIFRAVGDPAVGTCNFTNVDVAGLTALINQLTGLGGNNADLNALLGTYQSTGSSTCMVAANGRGVLNYPDPDLALINALELLGLPTTPPPPREFYLVSPGSGYFLETGYAGLGRFEPQTGSPYTLASLNGTYVYASLPAASLASINTSGIFTADGAGDATTLSDMNIGIGTFNVLKTDVANTSTYHLTDAIAGRFIYNTTVVIYEIAPGRFVLVDINPLTTSPSISLLY